MTKKILEGNWRWEWETPNAYGILLSYENIKQSKFYHWLLFGVGKLNPKGITRWNKIWFPFYAQKLSTFKIKIKPILSFSIWAGATDIPTPTFQEMKV